MQRCDCKIRDLLCILTERYGVTEVFEALWMESADPAKPCSTTDSARLQLGHWALPTGYFLSYERLSDYKCGQSKYVSISVRMGLLSFLFQFQKTIK